MNSAAQTLRETAAVVAGLGPPEEIRQLTDDALLSAQRAKAALDRASDTFGSWIAAEIARRSARELGHSGLAAREGFRSPAELISTVAGVSKSEAAKLVAVSTAPAAEEIARVGVDAVSAVNRGLGEPGEGVTAEQLDVERRRLLDSGTSPDELFRLARETRDRLDTTAVERREKLQQSLRYWRQRRREDGMVAGSYLLPADEGALLESAYTILMSPRRGGPRFDDELARRAVDDPRTDEQFAADGLVAMVDVAVDADAGRVFASKKPAVRVIVREVDLTTRAGHGLLEDSRQAISIGSVERYACESGLLGLRFDGTGNVIDVGRTQRLHTSRQRAAIAARDGGCLFPDCSMPVSMTEVHHPDHWDRDRGSTSVENGVSLCRFHHLMVHNNRWAITFAGGDYWLLPPPERDPEQRAIRLESKCPLLARAG